MLADQSDSQILNPALWLVGEHEIQGGCFDLIGHTTTSVFSSSPKPICFHFLHSLQIYYWPRECVSTGAAGGRTRRFSEHHLLHPLILRLLVLCAPADFEAHHLLHPQIQIPNAFPGTVNLYVVTWIWTALERHNVLTLVLVDTFNEQTFRVSWKQLT